MDTVKLFASELSYEDQGRLLSQLYFRGLASVKDVVTWAESVIDKNTVPPLWVTELYTLNSERSADYDRLLRDLFPPAQETTLSSVTLIARVEAAGFVPFVEILSSLWRALFGHDGNVGEVAKAEGEILDRLRDQLVEWDCLENAEPIPPAIESSVKLLLRELAEKTDKG